MLFKPYHISWIVRGRKTATRRVWSRPHARVDGMYPVQTRMFEKKGGLPMIRVERMYQQRLGEMTGADAKKEGYCSLSEFKLAWMKINGGPFDPNLEVTVIEFYYLEGTGCNYRP